MESIYNHLSKESERNLFLSLSSAVDQIIAKNGLEKAVTIKEFSELWSLSMLLTHENIREIKQNPNK